MTTGLTVDEIDRTAVEIPYRERPEPHMFRTRPGWNYFDIVEVTLDDGTTGFGETMWFYTWGQTTDEEVDRALGRNAATLMWDDSLGSGLQMALFDAVGKALDVPVHALLGDQAHDRTPLSWWAMDMPADDWLAEAERAVDRGYTNIKLKGRPWRDVRGIVAELSEALPDWFEIDIDFNETLLDAERALPVLEELEQHPQVNIFESPIPQEDVEGNKRLREELDTAIAMHYGRPPAREAVVEDVCGGFILNQGAAESMEQGAVASMADKPLWIQLVGTGLTTAFTVHLGAVLEAATWPAITCYQLYTEPLIESRFAVEEGTVAVPDAPGLGVTIDADAIERYAVEPIEAKPTPDRLIEVSWPDGRRMYFANYDPQMMDAALDGELPYYEPGVETRLLRDDGSDRWARLHEEALDGPVVESL